MWTPALAGVTAPAGRMPALHAVDPGLRGGDSGGNDSRSRSFVFIDILGSFVHFLNECHRRGEAEHDILSVIRERRTCPA
jgi:hypothetical protein